MENSQIPAIAEIKQEYKANYKKIAKLDKELDLKISRFKVAREKALEVWKEIKELKESYDTKLDVALYDYDENYYYIIDQINAIREMGHVFAERQKAIKMLKKAVVSLPDSATCERFDLSRDGHELIICENQLSHESKVNKKLEEQLIAEAEQMRVLVAIDFIESGELSKYPELESLKKNIDNLRRIFSETMIKVDNLQNEISKIKTERDQLLSLGIEKLEDAIAKISRQEKDAIVKQLKEELASEEA